MSNEKILQYSGMPESSSKVEKGSSLGMHQWAPLNDWHQFDPQRRPSSLDEWTQAHLPVSLKPPPATKLS